VYAQNASTKVTQIGGMNLKLLQEYLLLFVDLSSRGKYFSYLWCFCAKKLQNTIINIPLRFCNALTIRYLSKER